MSMLETWTNDWEDALGLDNEIASLRRGDHDAFDRLLARYQNRLYRYLFRLVRDGSEAEDLFQQTWLRVMTRIAKYDPRRPFEPWLFAIARNLAIDHLRRAKAESLDEQVAGTLASKRPGAFETVLARERQSALAAKIASLPLLDREALTLRFEEEMSFGEMATLLECPLSTVKSRVQRALDKLRIKLGSR